jgi:hypothetical protein
VTSRPTAADQTDHTKALQPPPVSLPQRTVVGQLSGLQIERTQAVPGYLFGLVQPSLLVRLRFAHGENTDALTQRFLHALVPHLATVDGLALVPLAPLPFEVSPVLAALADVVHRLQVAAGLTVLPEARLLEVTSWHCTLALPGPVPAAVGAALGWAMRALDTLAADPLTTTLSETLWNMHSALHERLARLAPGGTNKRHLLRVAYALGIPALALPGGVYQFGWGRRSRLFNSTISDGTGSIGTAWAKNKQQTNVVAAVNRERKALGGAAMLHTHFQFALVQALDSNCRVKVKKNDQVERVLKLRAPAHDRASKYRYFAG